MMGIVVDGSGDFAAFRSRFKGKHKIIKTSAPRGDAVDAPTIASRAAKDIAILRALNCEEIVVVTDFEGRTQPYRRFLGDLQTWLDGQGFGLRVTAVVPNRMIENWYLADIAFLSKKKNFLRDGLRQRNYEGTDGKREIKILFKRGISYNEVRHGGQMFATIRFAVARSNSNSFRDFLRVIGE